MFGNCTMCIFKYFLNQRRIRIGITVCAELENYISKPMNYNRNLKYITKLNAQKKNEYRFKHWEW
jgi:hypothetical protein